MKPQVVYITCKFCDGTGGRRGAGKCEICGGSGELTQPINSKRKTKQSKSANNSPTKKQPTIVKSFYDREYAKEHSLVSLFINLKTGKRDAKPWWQWGLGANGQLYCRGQISGWQLENWFKISRGLQPLITIREIKLIYHKFFILESKIIDESAEAFAMPW